MKLIKKLASIFISIFLSSLAVGMMYLFVSGEAFNAPGKTIIILKVQLVMSIFFVIIWFVGFRGSLEKFLKKEEIDLKEKFQKRLVGWVEKHGEEKRNELLGKLVYLGSCLPYPTLGDAIECQMKFAIEKTKKTEEELLNYIFESKDVETFMLRLQFLDSAV